MTDLLSDSPIARSTDPRTSHEAAASLGKRADQQRYVLDCVKRTPFRTSAELARDATFSKPQEFQHYRYLFARRLPELRDAGYLMNGRVRPCTVTGKSALTWVEVEKA